MPTSIPASSTASFLGSEQKVLGWNRQPREPWSEIVLEAAHYLQDLVRIDTSNPPGNERPGAEYLAEVLDRNGVQSELVGPLPHRTSLIARARGKGRLRPLLLVSHLDVVPAPTSGWSVHPFCGLLKDGFVWGRGAMDCKYRAVTHAMILMLLNRNRISLKRDVIIAACADEEAGGKLGMEWLAANHLDKIDAEFVLGEGGGGEIPTPTGRFCALGTGEKSSYNLTIIVRGLGGHTLRTRPGNALLKLGHVLGALENPHLSSELAASVSLLIESIARHQHDPLQSVLKALLSDSSRDAAMAQLVHISPELSRWLEPSIYNLIATTMVSGGVSPHAYPTEVRLDCNVRLLPGSRIKDAIEIVRSRLKGIDDVEIDGIEEEAYASESSTETLLYHTIKNVLQEAQSDTTVVPWLLGGATDVRFLRQPGRAVYGFFPSLVDLPFHEWMSITHGVDERVSLRNLEWAIRVFYELVLRICT